LEITVSNLHRSYLDADRTLTVIESLNFTFPEGRTVALLGASGIGKSTLLHLLGGLDLPNSGAIWYDEQNICTLSPDGLAAFRAKHVGFIFQFHHLLPEFSALENVYMPLLLAGESEGKAIERGKEILKKVGLLDRATHRPSQLSGGEQQRVAVARALINTPDVVLADEPTGNLDVKTAKEIERLLCDLNKSVGSTLIVATHSHDLAENMDDVFEMMPGGDLITWGRRAQ
jgi:lipoprotein-releasing system ATP-binding protein